MNGGHNPPLWYARARAEPEPLRRTGIMLGFDEDFQYAEARIRLEPGEVVVSYTDGLTEALNGSGERFGERRLRQVLATHRDAPAADILAATQAAVRSFAGSAPSYDDITLVVLRRA